MVKLLPRWVILALCLAVAAALAFRSLVGDSITYDETSHLTAGMSYLETGGFRLAPDHPPLSKMWAAWPLLLVDQQWPPATTPGWREGNVWSMGQAWLFGLNDGERLLTIARCMVVILLLATCLCIYAMARSLFGSSAGVLALVLAVLSPTLLAHGRLVTTDLPAALCMCAVVLAFARLMDRLTWARLGLTVAVGGALTLAKFSWPIVLPALLAMSVAAICRSAPICSSSLFQPRLRRVIIVGAIWLLAALVAWVMVWTCYGWRYSAFRGPDAAQARFLPDVQAGQALPTNQDAAWKMILHDRQGQPLGGAGLGFVRWARDARLLPEAYLYGLAYTFKSTAARTAYLNGRFSDTGWHSYFPVAFAIKTPIPVMLLALAGLAALLSRKARLADNPLLAIGLVTLVVVYAGAAIASNTNIGHRHLLPLYPPLMVLAGASAVWLRSRLGRWLVIAAVVWLFVANLTIHPHYLSYFNEIVGGPRNGHRYLADSNIDWGQDLKRLADYASSHPDERIKLAYFGSADPTRYGFDCQMLYPDTAQPAVLSAGTYVISVTHLLGVYWTGARDSEWDRPEIQRQYRALTDRFSRPPPVNETRAARQQRLQPAAWHQAMRRARLVNRLGRRQPDERIGYSLFVYRLTAREVAELTLP